MLDGNGGRVICGILGIVVGIEGMLEGNGGIFNCGTFGILVGMFGRGGIALLMGLIGIVGIVGKGGNPVGLGKLVGKLPGKFGTEGWFVWRSRRASTLTFIIMLDNVIRENMKAVIMDLPQE